MLFVDLWSRALGAAYLGASVGRGHQACDDGARIASGESEWGSASCASGMCHCRSCARRPLSLVPVGMPPVLRHPIATYVLEISTNLSAFIRQHFAEGHSWAVGRSRRRVQSLRATHACAFMEIRPACHHRPCPACVVAHRSWTRSTSAPPRPAPAAAPARMGTMVHVPCQSCGAAFKGDDLG